MPLSGVVAATAATGARKAFDMKSRALTKDQEAQIAGVLQGRPELHQAFLKHLRNQELDRQETEDLARVLQDFPGHFSESAWNSWCFDRDVVLEAYKLRQA